METVPIESVLILLEEGCFLLEVMEDPVILLREGDLGVMLLSSVVLLLVEVSLLSPKPYIIARG